jgi:hypothetical protein
MQALAETGQPYSQGDGMNMQFVGDFGRGVTLEAKFHQAPFGLVERIA